MKDHSEEKPEPLPGTARSGRHISFKKKSDDSNVPNSDTEYFKGLQVGEDRLNLYEKSD